MAKHRIGRKANRKPLKFPWTLLRPLFGILSILLFLVCLHSLIYISFIALKTPDCSQCETRPQNKQNEDKCSNFCDITADDFVFVYDERNRGDLLTYMGIILLLRCFAFFAGFIGVFTFLFFAMIVYLILHFSLIITFIGTIVFYAVQDKSLTHYVFGRTTVSTTLLSIEYSMELILFVIGLSISFKFFRIKYTENKVTKNKVSKDNETNEPKKVKLTVPKSDIN